MEQKMKLVPQWQLNLIARCADKHHEAEVYQVGKRITAVVYPHRIWTALPLEPRLKKRFSVIRLIQSLMDLIFPSYSMTHDSDYCKSDKS